MTKRKALGKGLGALIPDESQKPSSVPISCKIDDLSPNRRQPRKQLKDEGIEELTASIKELGIIQPIVTRKTDNGGYEIIAGERRWRAAKKAGLPEVPIIVREADDKESLEIAIIENLQRENLNPLEESAAYAQLIDEFGLTQEEVAKRVGKDRSTITNQLRLQKLPKEIQQDLLDGSISAGHARPLLSLDSLRRQLEVREAILKKGLSVRQTEVMVQQLKEKKPNKSNTRKKTDPHLEFIRDELVRLFNTQIRIQQKKKGGIFEIHYASNEELDRIIELFRSLKSG